MARTGGLSAADLATFVSEVESQLPDGRLVVALSGGADSAALAYAVSRADVPARAITVHHGLSASPSLVRAASEIASVVGLEHTVVDAPGGDSETELRRVRLEAIEKSLEADEWVVTGHTQDDQAETVLGNLLRGAGPAGLGGIPRRRRPWARPLLEVTRDRTRSVAMSVGLPFVDDPQNEDRSIRRNRIRHQVIPALEQDFNPGLRGALGRTAGLAAADDDTLAARADAVPVVRDGEAVLVPAAALSALPAAVAARVARRALRKVLDPYPGSSADVAAVVGAVSGRTGQIAGGHLAVREGPFVAIHAGEPPPPASPVSLPVPGEVEFGPWTIRAGPRDSAGLGRRGAEVAEGPLVVRAARPGDRVSIPGGAKKVVDALAEASVPERLRSRWPVVESNGRIVWVVAIRVADEEGGGVGLMAVRR